MPFDVKTLELFPKDSGVYLMKDNRGAVIYVGKAKVLRQRVRQYFSPGRDERAMIPFLIAEVETIETIIVPTEKEALLLENTLIKKHKPKYNAVLKDDKTYVSLMINQRHKWPMLKLVRYKGKPKEQGLYFGPYTSAFAARQTFDLLVKLFPLRQCSDDEMKRRTRPCLLYSIKRCVAPCVGFCSEKDYDMYVQGAIKFLKGQDREILDELYEKMQKASDDLEFEKAAALLKTIRQIEHVTQNDQLIHKAAGKDCDVIGLYREGEEVMIMQLLFREGKLTGSEHFSFSQLAQEDEEILSSFLLQHYKIHSFTPKEILLPLKIKGATAIEEILSEEKKKVSILTPSKGDGAALIKLAEKNAKAAFTQMKNHEEMREKILLDMQEMLRLTRYPKRIECFDTSNISGSDLVASLVAFYDGERDKKRTRYFHIKGIHKGDDYSAMRQAISRRLSKAKKDDDLPDLIIVDGGKGQLRVALDVCKELDIASVDVIALAKEMARHDKGMTLERVFIPSSSEAIHLPATSQILFFLQKIRDLAHEKAVQFHRKSRSKRTIKSALEEIPGIGPVKRKKLLTRFGSLKRVMQASDEELSEVEGITGKDIQAIRSAFHKE